MIKINFIHQKMFFALIPARMGSQRLVRKNLRKLGGVPLITRSIFKFKAAMVFNEIRVNSDPPMLKNQIIVKYSLN